MAATFAPTIFDVVCALGLEPQSATRQAMRKLGVTEVILDTDMIGSVCVGIMEDGSVFVDADDAVLAGESEPTEPLSDTLGRLLAIARGG